MTWKGVSPKPDLETVCRPEFGLTMVLGLVGAGGIGQVLFASIRGFYYVESAAILILVVITVTIVDLLSQQLRKLVI